MALKNKEFASHNFYELISSLEEEVSSNDDISLLIGYGIINGLLDKPIKGSNRTLKLNDTLAMYNGLNNIVQKVKFKSSEEVLSFERKNLHNILQSYNFKPIQYGIINKFFEGKNNLSKKINPLEYLRLFGSRTYHKVLISGTFSVPTQYRNSDYKTVEKVLEELK